MSPKTLRRIREILAHARALGGQLEAEADDLRDEIDRALTRRRGVAEKRKAKLRAWKSQQDRRADVRAAVFARADGQCEGRGEFCAGIPAELDHFFGRARSESVETCLALCSACHTEKTNNLPDAATWLRRYLEHCTKHSYLAERWRAESRLKFVTQRAAFGAGGAR